MRKIISLCLMTLILSGPFALAQKSSPTKDSVLTVQEQKDHAAQERLTRLFEASGWFPDLQVEVKEGLVFLSGSISNEDKKAWAMKMVEKTEGVVGVIDNSNLGLVGKRVLSPMQQEIADIRAQAERLTPYVISAIVLMALFVGLGIMLSRFTRRLVDRRRGNPLVSSALGNLVAIVVIMLGLYFALKASGLTTLAVTVLGGTGFVGIGIGLALRSTFENYSASLMISMREIFRKGEWVKIGDVEGIVHSVTTRGTTLMDFEGNTVTIPNAQVFNSVIRNFTRNPNMRTDFTISVYTSEDIEQAKNIILNVLKSQPFVLKEPGPLVMVSDFSKGLYQVRAYFWFDATKKSRAMVRSICIENCIKDLRKAGLSLETDVLFVNLTQNQETKVKAETSIPSSSSPSLDLNQTAEIELEQIKNQADAAIPAEKGENLLREKDPSK